MLITKKISIFSLRKQTLNFINFKCFTLEHFFSSAAKQTQNTITFNKVKRVFPFEAFIKQTKISYDPSIEKKMDELIKNEKKFENLQHHLHLFRKLDFWSKDLINSLVRKMFELGFNYKTTEKVLSLWGVLTPIAKFLDAEELEMAKKLFFQGFDVIASQKTKVSPNAVVITFRLAKNLNCYYPEFVNFLAQLDVLKFKFDELLFFLRDLSILKTAIDNLNIEEQEKIAFNLEFNKIISNKLLWDFLNEEIKIKMAGKLDEIHFIEILILINKFSVQNSDLRTTMLQVYKAKISQLSVLTFTKSIYNFIQINEIDEEFASFTKKEFLLRISNRSLDFKSILTILNANFSHKNCIFPPDNDIFEGFCEIIKENQMKIDISQASSILMLFAQVFYKKPEILKLLFDKIKESIVIIPYLRFSFIFRALTIFEYYNDVDLMRIFEAKLYNEEEKTFLLNIIEKKEQDYTKIVAAITWGMHAILLERPDIIQNLDKFKDFYEFFKKYYLDFVQKPLIKDFSSITFGRFGVYQILKVLGLRPIPEKIVDIFNIDIVIPSITLEKLSEIKQNLDLESAIERVNWLSSNPLELSKEIAEDKILAGKINENIEKESSLLIELHGPYHYLKSEGFLRGGTVLKERLLKKNGYNLLVISYSECLDFTNKFSRRQIFLDIIEKIENAIFKNSQNLINK